MDSGHSHEYSHLDRIRINEGAEKCRAALNETCRNDTRRAVALLNDERLMFPSLYILREQMEGLRIQRYLSPRHMLALQIANQIRGVEASGADYLSLRQESVHSTLKWMLETGADGEIAEDDYEQILDVAASVLINAYGDRDVLPRLADLIFKRNRDGRYIHDLVWALFRIRDPRALKLIAERVRSSNPKDAGLAAELLNLHETGVPADEGDPGRWYAGYLRWLEENDPYLYFTQESYQYSGKPTFCAVDLERKYLQKGVPSYDRQPLSVLDGDARESLAAFKRLSIEQQKVLSDYSQKLHGISVPAWGKWLHSPVAEQIGAAKAGWEGAE